MQIDSIEVFHVALPLRQPRSAPWGTADTLQTVLVRMVSGADVGWGEASPGNAPVAADEWAAGVFHCVRDWLMPAIVGARIDSSDELQRRLAAFRGNRYAKAAIDTAWWDLAARQQGKPLHRFLGGDREAVAVGPTFDRMATIDDLLAAIGAADAAGYARIGLKFRPGWDITMLHAVRQEFPVQTIHIDCEGQLQLGQMEMLCRLDDFMLAMIEQPLPADDLVGHAMVQETLRTALCLDEGVSTVEQAEMAAELQSCRWMKIEQGRVGGLTPAVAIHNACQANSIPCWVGSTPQSGLGARIDLALAAKANFTYPADYPAYDDSLALDLVEPLLAVVDPSDGKRRVRLWPEPGLGIEPDAAVLERTCLARAEVRG